MKTLLLSLILVTTVILLGKIAMRHDDPATAESRLSDGDHRPDGAVRLNIPVDGSLQNPAWSPDGGLILFTRFRDGYNEGPADLFIYDLNTGIAWALITDGSVNVNLPGSAWSPANGMIVFSSDRGDHDEIFLIDSGDSPGDEFRATHRMDAMAYEPSFSPDGSQVVFESHPIDVEGLGRITRFTLDDIGDYEIVSPQDLDCRQPNWSTRGDLVYQCQRAGQWDVWVNGVQVTDGLGDKTDASFSPDGEWIVYSADVWELELANLFILPVQGGRERQLTHWGGYDGAPSWSPDGDLIVFESFTGDPDDFAGTSLWLIDLSKWIFTRSKAAR